MADTGLLYCQNEFDKERYEELSELSQQLMSAILSTPIDVITNSFSPVKDYPTPMVDVRGFILNTQNEILLVQEKSDMRWSIPGGWADIGLSPTENVLKEIHEESGLLAEVVRLLAVYDKKNHAHPPQTHYVYKLIFHCKALTTHLNVSHDINQASWFPIHQLPPLSTDRILETQLHELYNLVVNKSSHVSCD